MLTPADIEQKQFSTTRFNKGYNELEVDAFLERVGSDYAYMYDELAAARKENAELRHLAGSSSPVDANSPSAQRLLEVAQRTADETIAQANVEAHQIKAKAEHAAEKVQAEAEAAAGGIRQRVEAEVSERLAEVDAEIAQKREQLALMEEARSNAASSLRAALESLEV